MLAFHPASYFMVHPIKDEPLNEDHAYYLSHAPAPTPDRLLLRLLPRVIRAPMKAYLEARAYERTLVNVWEISPHLLDDIGVVLGAGSDVSDDLIAAPERVVAQVAAIERARTVQPVLETAAPIKPEPKAAPDRKPVREATLPAPFANRPVWSVEGSV